MSDTKNYGISGIGSNVELGKRGNRFKNETDKISVRDFDDANFVPISAGDPVGDNDLVTKSYLEQQAFDPTLKSPDDGDLTDGAVTDWTVGSTTYSTAIDDLNGILGRLVPTAPPELSTFTINATSGSNQLLAQNAIDNTTNAPSAGSSVYTVFDSSFQSTQANGGNGAFGGDVEGADGNLFLSGETGTLFSYVNGTQDGSIVLDGTDNTGTYGSLEVLSDTAYPADTPGFYTALKARINKSAVSIGYNEAYLEHSETGSTNTVSWVYDDVANAPSISNQSYSLDSAVSKQSSGINHMTDGDTLNVSATVDNLVGQTYITGTVLRFTTGVGVGTLNMDATQLGTGLTFPLDANLGPQTTSGKTLSIASTATFDETDIQVRAWNANGATGSSVVSGDPVLVYTSALEGGNKPHESQINGSSADAYRYYLGSGFTGDTPSGTLDAPTTTNWDSTQLLNASGYEHEAVTVAGVVKHDTTNYTTGYIPVTTGADYSTKGTDQYVTYVFNQSTLSSISLDISGSYSGLWVALPGISDDAGISPNALGGNWWDAFELYNGSGAPGRTGDSSAGCAVGSAASGSSGTVNLTFGTQSTTNSTNNAVIVRIKLNAGDSISALSIGNTP
ncbi:hypothetical protein PBI_SCTP2_230 [Salicola phage SCTP-2]|nr:hypothetical protein PBI_SCTP2_230 [Salicola phage SCTP-2]